jgi:Nucleotidyl transferase AbiEii toxin, Type IV TA system
MTIAARMTETYADELCFKGGFVLRHVHGHEPFSRDIDATRVRPPKHKLDAAAEVTAEITRASVGSLVAIRAAAPATDSGRSLDFERVDFTSPLSDGRVSVEISYREDVLDPRTEQSARPTSTLSRSPSSHSRRSSPRSCERSASARARPTSPTKR